LHPSSTSVPFCRSELFPSVFHPHGSIMIFQFLLAFTLPQAVVSWSFP
jgi:hypothetical protein